MVDIEKVVKFLPRMMEALADTGIMIGFAAVAALMLGLPLGLIIYLGKLPQFSYLKTYSKVFDFFVNMIRSVPFLLLVVMMQPAIRTIYGRATGDPIAASIPLMMIAIALYSRFVEQSFLDMGPEIIETAQAFGADTWQFVRYFLLVETKSSLVIGFTSSVISFLSYSTIMGVVGGGGIGDFAIRYGYQRYENDLMFIAIFWMILLVNSVQYLGLKLAKKIDKRK